MTEEHITRIEAAEQTWASARLEGFEPTAEDLKINQLWIDGKLSTEDLLAVHRAQFQKTINSPHPPKERSDE